MIRVCLIGENIGKEKALLESQSEIELHTIEMSGYGYHAQSCYPYPP